MPDWTLVASGIEYRQFTLPDPNNIFVARMERGNLSTSIESCIAQGRLVSGKETVSGMAARYDQIVNYWGQTWGPRNKVVVAINGDFHDPTTGLPTSGQIHSGGTPNDSEIWKAAAALPGSWIAAPSWGNVYTTATINN